MLDAQARKIVEQLVEADKHGANYITALMNNECDLTELFDRKFDPRVKRRVYQTLEVEEMLAASKL
jgi:hypothetical protein